ncbi:MAG: uroporphyrinogen-III C-methyltransferase [Gemmatimonadetes bacterium]|nr:uroporphyrinogen-III C-methyltransferase [Gemmatimonadota bacterium]MBT7593288.1 uroporphyrinogen-III C-methyltransferase [Gemmatimonadota bacterium]
MRADEQAGRLTSMDHLPHAMKGCVYIIGAGPGDPGLLTVKGWRFLSEADIVFYDDLLDPRVLELAPPACERVYAGHRGGRPTESTRRQDDLNQQLIDAARAGHRVVRLKGGDPYVFGRGGEEAIALRDAGIPFEVVSGVSAAMAVPAYAGIPLTHRGVAQTATLVTGHEDPSSANVDWASLARAGGTLVIFMGSRRVGAITRTLIEAGRAETTPAAAIQWGTRPQQRTITATLATLEQEMATAQLRAPVLLVVGEVVAQRQALEWFEGRPLFGRRILITRSREQCRPLRLLLEAEGGEVFELPMLQLSDPEDAAPLDKALTQLQKFQWIIFTSPNAVSYFFTSLQRSGRDARALGSCRIATIGSATASHLADYGISPDLTPTSHSSAGLAAAFADIDLQDAQILIPSSAIGITDLDEELERRGAKTQRVTAYENHPPNPDEVEIPEALSSGEMDCVVFASPSAVHHFVELLGRDQAFESLAQTRIAVIGPTTARAITALGLQAAIQPDTSSVEDLVRAISADFDRSRAAM